MYLNEPITGESLPEGTVCLTFDDGPGSGDGDDGPQTLRLAEYLADNEVAATFFLVGKYVERLPEAPAALRRLGHCVGNHTHHHANLVDLQRVGGDVAGEVRLTEALVGPADDGTPLPFRPPYGAWSVEVAAALQDDVLTAAGHVGPVLWDIDGRDWASWRDGVDPDVAARRYLELIEARGHGIVLMHDSTADSQLMLRRNRTLAMVTALVPWLRERGYAFVGLDGVAGFTQAASPRRVLLREAHRTGAASPGDEVHLELRDGRTALLRDANGRVLAPVAEGHRRGLLRSDRNPVAGAELFDVVPVGAMGVALRSVTGHFVTRGREGGLSATVTQLGKSEVFACDTAAGTEISVGTTRGGPLASH